MWQCKWQDAAEGLCSHLELTFYESEGIGVESKWSFLCWCANFTDVSMTLEEECLNAH